MLLLRTEFLNDVCPAVSLVLSAERDEARQKRLVTEAILRRLSMEGGRMEISLIYTVRIGSSRYRKPPTAMRIQHFQTLYRQETRDLLRHGSAS